MFNERTTLQKLLLLKALSGGGQSLVERTALGNPLTFGTDVSEPLKSLLIPFTPIQQGTGDPSTTNVRDIVPWNGLTVWNGGKNLLDPSTLQQGGIDSDGTQTSSRIRIRTDYIPIKENTVYVLSGGRGYKLFLHYYDANKASIGSNTPSKSTAPSGACFVRGIIGYSDDSNIIPSDFTNGQLEPLESWSGSATAYEPYKPITETDISFPSPVYGGTLSVVSGVLRVQWAGFSATWGDGESATDMGEGITRKVFPMVDYLQTGQANNMCNIAPYSANENASVHFYYSGSGATNRKCRLFLPSDTPDTTVVTVITKLSQTYEVQLTPAQITALVGNNTIWSDADGSMTAVYIVSSKYAEDHPVGGLGSGLGSGLLGSGTEDNPEDPADDPIEDPEEEIPDNTEEGSESDD